MVCFVVSLIDSKQCYNIDIVQTNTKQPATEKEEKRINFHLILFGSKSAPKDDCQWDTLYADTKHDDSFDDYIEAIIEMVNDSEMGEVFENKWTNCLRPKNRDELIIKIGEKASNKRQINWKNLENRGDRVQLFDTVLSKYNIRNER